MILTESAVVGLICLYLWFLAARSSIMDIPRSWFEGRVDFLDDLMACPWCLGFWLAGVVAGLGLYLGDFHSPLWILWGAGAAVCGWLGNMITDRG